MALVRPSITSADWKHEFEHNYLRKLLQIMSQSTSPRKNELAKDTMHSTSSDYAHKRVNKPLKRDALPLCENSRARDLFWGAVDTTI